MKEKVLLILILLLSLALRIFQVGELPLILNRDEAALAYNAYLIEQSGQDEWQQKYPLSFKSFGDYKLPGYIYTLVALYKFAPVSDALVRTPSVFAGVIIVFLSYVLAKKVFKQDKLALLVALITSILPNPIFYSRMAWEANLGLMFSFTSIILLFFTKTKTVKQQLIVDFVAIVLTFLSVFTYNAPFLYLPIILILIPIFRFKKGWRFWLPVCLSLLLILGASWLTFSQLSAQKSNITIFTDSTVRAGYIDYRQTLSGWQLNLFGNQYIYWLKIIASNLFNSFSIKYLVLSGGSHPWHTIPGHGHIYGIVYLFGLTGIVWLLASAIKQLVTRQKISHYQKFFLILALTIAALIPAIVTVDAPHATRSLLFFVLFPILAVYGFKRVNSLIKNDQLVWLSFVAILALEASLFFKDYFLEYPHQQAALKPGFDIVIQEVDERFPNEKIAVVADGYQYILAAWYLKLEPSKYFSSSVRQNPDTIGLSYGQQVDQYHFIAEPEDRSAEEKLMLSWDEQEELWELERF